MVKKDGVSFGNKAGYHHHGLWFARNGYCCMIIDTLQLGEIPGEHHGYAQPGQVVVALSWLHQRWGGGVELHPCARLPGDPP